MRWTFWLMVVFVAACGSGEGATARTDPDAVHIDGARFRDGRGRQLLFRGYNAKVQGIFDVAFADGRTPNYTFPPFDEADAQRFEELGFNAMRMTVSWSALEPQPRQYPAAFFAKVDEVVALAKQHHFYVLVDMHQDGYSKEIGEDGAPLWAIVPPPAMVLQGPSDDSRRLTEPVLVAGFNFFANLPAADGRPLQVAYRAAVAEIVKRHAGDPVILGYEAMNEPVVLDYNQLDIFHEDFADMVHAIDRDAPVLFEPLGNRNQSDEARLPVVQWSHGPGAYAPHIYTGQFSIPSQNGWESEDPAKLAPSMVAARAEADAWGTALFVTEFDCDQSTPRGPKWLSAELDLQDRFLASSTVWAWEPGDWGIADSAGVERDATVRVVARMYPRAVAGDLVSIEHPEPTHLRVHYTETARTRGLSHEVGVSAAVVTSYAVMCDGAAVPFTAATGRATFVCPPGPGDHVFDVIGVPKP